MSELLRWTLVVAIAAGGCGRRNFNEPDGGGGEPDAPTCPASYTPQAGTNVAWGPADGIATWVAAQMTCVDQGMTLAIPRTGFEALALVEHTAVAEAWTGINAIDTPGTWSTPDGIEVTYLPWDPNVGEPSGDGPCVMIKADAELGDADCLDALTFACECRTP